jgi:glucose/mannose-6-phosphate isomerase
MGGSGLGGHLIKSLYKDKMTIPVEVVSDYTLPAYANEKTLVIICSYSGNTEETLSVLAEAKMNKTKIVTISSGGDLAKKSKTLKIPNIIFSSENNPSAIPRVGLGYSIFALKIILAKLDQIKLTNQEVKNIIEVADKYARKFGVMIEQGNVAKKMIEETSERSMWFVASEHLSANAHIAANQTNESGKRFAGYFLLPEMNHHLLEGMFFPVSNKKNILFIFLESDLYSTKIKKRIQITKNILKKNGIKYESYICEEKDKILQAYEIMVFGGFLSFYLAMAKNINPSAIPYVDYLKKELRK